MLLKINKKFFHTEKLKKQNQRKKYSELQKSNNVLKFDLARSKKKYRYSNTIFNRKFLFIPLFLYKFQLQIYIKVCQNNIFCTLRNIHTNQILFTLSCGILKLDTSKKKLNYNIKFILETFLKNVNLYLRNYKNLIIQIVSIKKYRKKILGIFRSKLKNKNIILRTKKNKCFNGCRPSKKRRKKRMFLKLLI
jgi:ribosomal protein S11